MRTVTNILLIVVSRPALGLVLLLDPVLTLVAEEPPPALLTVALPGLLAGPVETARVANALVAVAAFESHSAPVVVQLGGNTGQSTHINSRVPLIY